MPRFTRSFILAGAMAGLIAVSTNFTAAQTKKPKDSGKDDKHGTVEINKDKGGQFRFKVVGPDGKAIVQSSKGYATKADAEKAIDSVKSIINSGKVVEGKEKEKDK